MEQQIFLNKDFFSDDEYVVAKFDVERREPLFHSHEFWEISYVCESEGTSYSDDGNSEPIKTGEFVFVSPGAVHCIASPPKEQGAWVRVCNMLIRSEYIEKIIDDIIRLYGFDEYALIEMIKDKKSFCIHFKDQSKIVMNMLASAAHEYKFPLHGSEAVIKNLTTNVLIYLARFYEEMIAKSNVTATEYDVIDDVINHIKSNFGRDLNLDYLAAYAHMSPSYLSRTFKRRTGMKLSDFITKTRLERAKSLLRFHDYSVQDISTFCGYNNIANFHKSFKKYTNMTASEYRAMKKR